MELMVSAIRINGDDNLDIELVDPRGADLPSFAPGAHIDSRTPAGQLRQYSLCGPVGNRRSYRICARRDEGSRGGSRSLHHELRVRARVEVSAPRNLFTLPEAKRYILFSAGIGITPIISMARALCDNLGKGCPAIDETGASGRRQTTATAFWLVLGGNQSCA